MIHEDATTRVLSSVIDPRMGGPQNRSLDVARKLRERCVETVFLIPDGDGGFNDAATEAGFETHQVPLPRIRPPQNVIDNLRFLGTFPWTTGRIAALLREKSIDVVHANMPINFQTALAAARADVPLVWHFNDTLTPTPVKQVAALAGRRWADELVVAADAVHDYYFSPQTSSTTLYAPVDIDAFHPDRVEIDEATMRDELGLQADVPVVGTVGNLNPIKGHKYLLRAIATVLEDGRKVAVPIVGAPLNSREAYFHKLRSLRASLGLEDQVQFVGFRSDIPQLLSLFDIFVLPSVAEACPIVVLEAMAMKCPVVATAVGGVPEEIPDEDYGWVVPPKDSDALANAIENVLADPGEGRRRAENARRRVKSVFSLEACVDRHEDLYRSLVNDS